MTYWSFSRRWPWKWLSSGTRDRAVWYTANYRLDIQEDNNLYLKKSLLILKQNVKGFKDTQDMRFLRISLRWWSMFKHLVHQLRVYLRTSWVRVFYPDLRFVLSWLRFFYPDWGFSILTEVFPILTEVFPILIEVFLSWLRVFLSLLRFFLSWLRFFLFW